jgi:heterotetrameric sarcosine oxidase gamma subunit
VSAPERRSVLDGHLNPGRYGAPDGEPVRLREIIRDAVEVAARRGREAEVRTALAGQGAFEIAPGLHLAMARSDAPGALAARLRTAVGDAAAVVEAGHGLAVLELSGPPARHVLSKLCRLDLHPRAFEVGKAVRTLLGQIPGLLWLEPDGATFGLAVPLTFAQSFVHHLLAAAAETGCEVLPASKD